MSINLKISVIIPVYNAADFLEETLHTVFNQTYQPAEVIIIDDGSTDQTAAIIQNMDYPIRYIFQENAGSAAACNVGIRSANYDWIAFLDHDDIWHPQKLEQQVALLQEQPNTSVVFSWVDFFYDKKLTATASKKYELPARPMKGFLRSCILFNQSILTKSGRFNEELKVAESIDWLTRVKDTNTMIGMVPEVLTSRRIHGNNTSIQHKSRYIELLTVLRNRIRQKENIK